MLYYWRFNAYPGEIMNYDLNKEREKRLEKRVGGLKVLHLDEIKIFS